MSRRADIRARIIHHEDGSLSLAPPGAKRGSVEMSAGRIVTRPSTKPDPQPSERNALLTRAECAVVLGVPIEEAARLLDVYEVPRNLGYDGQYVRALRDKLADRPVLTKDKAT